MKVRFPIRSAMLAATLLAIALLAFQARDSSATPAQSDPSEVSVALAEWSVAASPSSVATGDVKFNATNNGANTHELVVIKTEFAANALPLNDAGTRVDEHATGVENLGEIEDTDLPSGASASATFNLPIGKYVLICNIENHYGKGMYTAFTVTQAPTPTATATATPTPTATATAAATATPTPTATATVAAVPKTGGPPSQSAGLPWLWLGLASGLAGALLLAGGLAWRRRLS